MGEVTVSAKGYLLDTHVFLWWLFDAPELSSTVRNTLADPSRRVLVSSASAWEIATKVRLGKLPEAKVLAEDLQGWIERAGFAELPMSVAHAQRAGSWALAHRDPFDRMLAAQSEIEGLALVSKDPALREFGIEIVW